MPNRGRGQFLKMANYLSVSPVSISQIFKADRHLTVEQACELVEYFGFTKNESDYFIGLVEYERAGSVKLKKRIEERLAELRERAQNLKHRIKHEVQLSEEAKAIFYSQWYYSGVRLLTAVDGFHSADRIAQALNLPIRRVNEILEFLVSHGLCIEKQGHFKIGVASTHIGADHPLVSRHHANWRFKVLERLNHLSNTELCLTLPCAISEPALKQIRKELVDTIERVTQKIDDSPSEFLSCINIDLFKV